MTGTPPLIAVEPARVAPGGTASVVVELRNDAAEPREHLLRVVGLDPAWSPHRVLSGRVAPGTTVRIEVLVTVPKGSPAGRFPFVVTAEPRDAVTGDPLGGLLEADATVVVGDASRVLMTLLPREPSGVGGKRFSVLVENRTTEPLSLRLDTESTRNLQLRIRRPDIEVPVGGTAKVRVNAAVDRRLTGQARRIPFVLTAQGATTPVRLDATFRARPILSTMVTRVVAVLALLSLWAGLGMMAVGRISDRGKDQAASADLVAGAPEPDTGGEDGDGGDGDGGSGAAGDDGPGSSTSLRAARRINGVVKGDDPAGARVTLQRTSLVSEEAQTAQLVGLRLASSVGKVSAASIAYDSPTLSPVRATTTGPDGSWAFADVATSGYYLLTVSKPGYGTRRMVVQQRPDQALEPVEVELKAGTGKLSGKVTSLGRPVPGASLVITDGDVTVTTTTRTTGAVGEWAVDGLSTPGSYLVTSSADGLATASALVPLGAGGSAGGVDLDLARGVQSLVGTVTATTATGRITHLGGVVVSATSTGDDPVTRSATTVTRAPDGSAAPVGSFVLPDLSLGRWTITYSADGYADRTEEVVLDGATSSLTLASHLSTSGSTVRGAVTDGDGAGLVGAGLVLEGTEGTYKLTSADGGSFAVAGVVPGTYVLTAEKAGHETASVGVVAVAGGISQADVVLPALPDAVVPETSSVRGRVVDARNGGLVRCPEGDDACILVQVDDRAPVRVTPSAEYTVPGDDPGLEPGLHTVRVTATGYEGGEATVQVPEGGVAIAPVIAVYPKPAIIGKVTPGAAAPLPPTCVVGVPSEDGPPVTPAGCTLTVTPGSPDACTVDGPAGSVCALVDPSGNYALDALDRAGVWWVSVLPVGPIAADWIPVPPASVTLTRGETRRYDTQLDRKAQLRVLIREPGEGSGLAVPTVPVTVEVFPAESPSGSPAIATVTSGITRPDGTVDLGQALVTGLPDGRLRLIVSGTIRDSAYSAQVPLVEVGTNSTSEVTAVLTPSETNQLVGRVVWRQDRDVNGVGGIQVTVTGTTGYDGTVPQRRQVTLTTGDNGCFAVTADGAAPASAVGECGSFAGTAIGGLGFVTQSVDIKVEPRAGTETRGAFEGLTTGALAGTGDLVEVVLKPPTRTFSGQLHIDDELPTADQVREKVLSFAEVRVTTPAPGAGTVVITPGDDGTLSWADSTLPAGQVAPGTYTVIATAPGFDVARGTLVCALTAEALADGDCFLDLSLGSWVDLVFNVSESGEPGKPVPGAIVTASGGNLPTTTLAVPPGETTVTFPDLSPAAGAIRYEVRAPGFRAVGPLFRTLSTDDDGQEVVTLERLGSIEGTVLGRAGGQDVPLAGVVMTATYDHDSDPATTAITFSDVTDAAGRYRISGTTEVDGLEGGVTWTVTADADGTGYGAAGELVKTTTIPTPSSGPRIATLPFVLTADLVALTVRVVADDAARTALTSARDGVVVRLTPPAGSAFSLAEGVDPGTFVQTDLVPTLHLLEVTAPNRASVLTTVLLQPRIGATITIALPDRLNTLSVRVSEQVGIRTPEPLSGATVTLSVVNADGSTTAFAYDPPPTDPADPAEPRRNPKTTGADGLLEFPSLPDGTYSVTITGPLDASGVARHRPVTTRLALRLGQFTALDALLQLPLPQVTVAVSSTSGDSMEGATATLVATGGGGVGQGGQRVGVADSAGTSTVVFPQVLPGTYVVQTTGPSTHLAGTSAPVTVTAADESTTVTVAERQIDLTLTADVGTPRATVTVQPASNPGLVTTYTLLVGESVPDTYVPADEEYTITASAAGYATATYTGTASAVALELVRDGSGALRITVMDGATGARAIGATVTVSGSQLEYGTGPAGADVLVAGLSPGAHDVRVVLADGRTRTESRTVAGATTTDTTVTVPADAPAPVGSLDVTVRRGTTPLPGAVVTVTGRATAYLTNASGVVNIPGLAPGFVSVQASAPSDGATTSARVEVLNSATPTAVALTLPVASNGLLDVVVRQGSPVVGASVVVSGQSTVHTTGSAGKVSLTGLPVGTVSVQAYLSNGASVVGTATAKTASPDTLTLDLPTAAAGTRTLNVSVDLAGSNLSGATVTVSGLAIAYVTGGSGNLTIPGVSTGDVAVQATAPDGRVLTRLVPAATTTTAVPFDFPVAPTSPAPASLTVQVRNGGAAVPNATVTLNGPAGSASAITGTSGDVTLTGLAAGTYTLSATTPDYQAGSKPFTLAAGDSATTELQVEYVGTVEVTVQRAGAPQAGASVTVGGVAALALTDAAGKATVRNAPRGAQTASATVTVTGTTYTGSSPVNVFDGATATVGITVS